MSGGIVQEIKWGMDEICHGYVVERMNGGGYKSPSSHNAATREIRMQAITLTSP
jgi:hypothetical protein